MAKKLRLGVIGMSDGNGHPYSWSAIFNGYDKEHMASCPFPVIPNYLGNELYPNDFLIEFAEVTHIWTQSLEISKHIAKASRISNVCKDLNEMIGLVDAVLLARDDAENHYFFARPFLEAGLPVYIDKPFATDRGSASRLWALEKYDNQIFTCSAMQFAKEFNPEKIDSNLIGEIKFIQATISKSWDKYAVHIVEPVLNILPQRGRLEKVMPLPVLNNQINGVYVQWESGVVAHFQTTGDLPVPLTIRIQGVKGYQELHFKDTFYAFKTALRRFVNIVNGLESGIPKAFTLEMVQILEGIKNA